MDVRVLRAGNNRAQETDDRDMSQRRIKSIMHGSAEDTRIYHHEHRSARGRDPLYWIRKKQKFLRDMKLEKIQKYERT